MTQTQTLRAGVYGRESKGKTKSVYDQLNDCHEAVQDEGWSLAGTWQDGVSASRHGRRKRTGWPEVRAAIDTGAIDVLVVWETSRGSRTPAEWIGLLDACREKGILVHVLSHERTYDPRRAHDYKTLANDGVDAGYETDRLSERVCRGTGTAAAAGGVHGRVPYGFMRQVVGTKRTSRGEERPVRGQLPDPTTAPIVKEIITRVASMEPIRRICLDLHARGIQSPNGSKWGHEQIHQVVKNPAYVGLRRHRPVNGDATQLYPAQWDGIVPRSIWDAANVVLADPARRKFNAPGRLKYLLTVIATAPCGGGMGIGRSGNTLRYTCISDGCTSIGMEMMDEYVTRIIVARLSRKDARKLWVADDTASQAAAAQLADLEQQLKDNDDAYRRNEISARLAGIREAELLPQIEDARKRSRPTGTPLALLEILDAAQVGKDMVRPAWERAPLPAKREIIRIVFKSIVVGPASGRLSRWADEDERLRRTAERVTVDWR